MARKQVAFQEDIKRLEAALAKGDKDNAHAIERGSERLTQRIDSVDRNLSRSIQTLTAAVEDVKRGLAVLDRFFHADGDGDETTPETRRRNDILTGALGGARHFFQYSAVFGPKIGAAMAGADTIVGALVGSMAEGLRQEGARRRRDREDATYGILLGARRQIDHIAMEESAFYRAQRGLR